jgi:hypothetical protein
MTLTPEQIRLMSAGPAMNAAVAAGLGCTVGRTGGPRSRAFCACHNRTHGEPHSSEGAWAIKPYSEDSVAAWSVAEHIANSNAHTIVSVTVQSKTANGPRYFCTIEDVSDGIEEWEASADSMPLAISKAALLVLVGRQDAAREGRE